MVLSLFFLRLMMNDLYHQEFLLVKLKIALFGALLVSFPYFSLELYSFISPGLYKKERVAMAPYFIFSPFLFILGGLLVHYIIMPLALSFFSNMQIDNSSENISILICKQQQKKLEKKRKLSKKL